MTPFVGFAPDLPPETPGVFSACTNVLPSVGKFVGAPAATDTGLGAISATATGFAVTRKSDNTARVFCGNAAKLYEQSGGAWSEKSKVGGYTNGPDDRWRFAQFGDVTLATAKSTTLQAITTASFADASGTAPKAAIVETINNQVFLANIDGMGFGNDPLRWACSALGSYTDYTPAVSTQCVSGQLLDSPGGITAGRRLGDIMVLYKNRAMYIGQYVGVPTVWDIRRIPGEIGTHCQEAVINTGTAHYFVGPDDFYVFDGTRPVPLDSPVRQWFFTNLDQAFSYKIWGTFDRINQRAYWWFPDLASNGALNKCIVLNVKTGQWGRLDLTIECVADYVSSGITYDQLGTLYATYNDLPTTISYDSPFWNSGSSVIAVFKPDHKAYQLTGNSTESRITTGHYGDNTAFSSVSRIRPRFLKAPTSATLDYAYSNTDSESFTTQANVTMVNGNFDFLWSARWHRVEFVFHGPVAISGADYVYAQDGTE